MRHDDQAVPADEETVADEEKRHQRAALQATIDHAIEALHDFRATAERRYARVAHADDHCRNRGARDRGGPSASNSPSFAWMNTSG